MTPLTTRFTTPIIDLAIVQANPTDIPGQYRIIGKTTLPDQTELTVSAIRSLEVIADGSSSYSILDRQVATVTQGIWEAELMLWKVAPDGQFQEGWQMSENLMKTEFKPLPGVSFSAILEPKDASKLKATIERQDAPQVKALEQYNADGELYLQAIKEQTLSLPSGKTDLPDIVQQPLHYVPSATKVDIISNDETPVGVGVTGSRSDAPLSPDAYLR